MCREYVEKFNLKWNISIELEIGHKINYSDLCTSHECHMNEPKSKKKRELNGAALWLWSTWIWMKEENHAKEKPCGNWDSRIITIEAHRLHKAQRIKDRKKEKILTLEDWGLKRCQQTWKVRAGLCICTSDWMKVKILEWFEIIKTKTEKRIKAKHYSNGGKALRTYV